MIILFYHMVMYKLSGGALRAYVTAYLTLPYARIQQIVGRRAFYTVGVAVPCPRDC